MILPWGDDTYGTAEPFTVLAPDGSDARSPDAIVVSVTGFRGYEGGLAQASPGDSPAVRSDRFVVDGREAIFTPAQPRGNGRTRWADLVVVRGRDLAVRVTARRATKQRLLDVLARVRPSSDHSKPPTVPDPPSGFHVVGSVDADVTAGFHGGVSDLLPTSDLAPAITHGIEWTSAHATLMVQTLPGRSASLGAMSAYTAFSYWRYPTVRSRSIGGAPAMVITSRVDGSVVGLRAVFVRAAWGDLVMVVSFGRDGFSEQELVDVAASVRPTTEAEWQRFVAQAPPAGP